MPDDALTPSEADLVSADMQADLDDLLREQLEHLQATRERITRPVDSLLSESAGLAETAQSLIAMEVDAQLGLAQGALTAARVDLGFALDTQLERGAGSLVVPGDDDRAHDLSGRPLPMEDDNGRGPSVTDETTHDGQPQDPNQCVHDPLRAPSFGSPCLRVEWNTLTSRWDLELVTVPGCTPDDVFIPPVTQFRYITDDGQNVLYRGPMDRWPDDIRTIISPEFISTTDFYRNCRWTVNVTRWTGGGGSIVLPREPILLPPIEPIRPRQPPVVQPPTTLPPIEPIEPPIRVPPCPPHDPCFPAPLTLVSAYHHTVAPLPVPYWLRLRCTSHCDADVECWSGDCPPPESDGWRVFGPWLSGCPDRGYIEGLVRSCFGPSQPPTGPKEVPDYVEPPPPTEPPPDWTAPPPLEQCDRPRAVRPQYTVESYVPVCTTYEQWAGPVTTSLASYGDVEDIMDDVLEQIMPTVIDDYAFSPE